VANLVQKNSLLGVICQEDNQLYPQYYARMFAKVKKDENDEYFTIEKTFDQEYSCDFLSYVVKSVLPGEGVKDKAYLLTISK
jgi:hypothetical protein